MHFQAMDLLSGLIPYEEHESGQTSVQLTPEHLERLYIFAVMWSVGALLELDNRAKMEQFMREDGGGEHKKQLHLLQIRCY